VNIKTKNLTVSDFPGIDEAKFNEWKALQIKLDRESRIVWLIMLTIWFISTFLITGRYSSSISFLVLAIAVYGIYFVRTKRLRQLRKELKISDRLWAKKKGRAFTG
jgi:Flp pilus assembly protein TadB